MSSSVDAWAGELVDLYESNAASQFIIYGNVHDRMLIPAHSGPRIGTLTEYLMEVLLPRFDVVLSYDLGNGIRIEKGGPLFATWPFFKDNPTLPKTPRPAIETLTHYFRYCANLARLNRETAQVGCLIRGANLIAPASQSPADYDLGALVTLIRDWSSDNLLASHSLATFLITENLNDLHPLLVNNARAAKIEVPLPSIKDLSRACSLLAPSYPIAIADYADKTAMLAEQFTGATLGSIEKMFKTKEHSGVKLCSTDLIRLKKQIVEQDANGLIEFVESSRTLDDLYGQEKVKSWLRQDLALWKVSDTAALPKGYLICGPVGTGKTFLVECLAGEAGVPVVKLKNFRDRWVGSTEGNLEKIFRLLQALNRCYVFIDEADQVLGKRDAGSNDSGISGRIYSMIAEEMGRNANRGRIIWVLASSRPDLIEVDLKRPGRVDVRIPLFPTTTPEESFHLLRRLCQVRGVTLDDACFPGLETRMPLMLTPGAAETLAVKVYRLVRTQALTPEAALAECLTDYRNPIAPEVLRSQIELAIRETTDLEFVPASLRTQ